jgi:hypothetical protein
MTCDTDSSGKIKISAAHSIQNNGVLSKVAQNGHVMSYVFEKVDIDGGTLGRNIASIFWGFCNTHDAIFRPIENYPYTGTVEQHFLFAYRGFVVAAHKKIEVATWMDYGEQSDNDINENRKVFDTAILNGDYGVIETQVFELPAQYPIAVSSSFFLDFDFEGNEIPHSDERMENLFITLLPADNRTFFLLSYFSQDKGLYERVFTQRHSRNNLKSDLTMLIAGHVENVYFNPTYYETFIRQQEEKLNELFFHTQFDYAKIGKDGKPIVEFSMTPSNYLDNPYGLSFFGY